MQGGFCAKEIFLWHDIWHPKGILYKKYRHWVIYDAAKQLNLKQDWIQC